MWAPCIHGDQRKEALAWLDKFADLETLLWFLGTEGEITSAVCDQWVRMQWKHHGTQQDLVVKADNWHLACAKVVEVAFERGWVKELNINPYKE